MKKSDITVIIPTMNRLETLKETLDSYMLCMPLPDQIVIVDQTQDEELRKQIIDVLRTYEAVTIDYLYQQEPSLTKARNAGIAVCRNDVVVVSDDDVTVATDTLKNISDIMNDEAVSMIAGINSRDGFSKSKLGYLFGKKSFKKRNTGHVTKAMFGRFPEEAVKGSVKTEWAMGFFFVVRKSLIQKWNNYWDENLSSYAYAEDLDFSYSYYRNSEKERLKCILNEGVVVEHRVSSEWRVPSKKSTMMYVINREYLSYKHKMGFGSRLLTRWANIGEIFMRMLKRGKPLDMLKAQVVCDLHRKEIADGIINPIWYQ